MKLAYVFASLNPGGSEKQTAQIVVRLRELGHDVTIVLPNSGGVMDGNLAPYLAEHAVPTIDLSARPDKIPSMQEVFEDLRPEVVNSNGYPMTINGSLAAYLAKVPLRVIRYENTGFTREEFPQDWKFELAGHAVTHAVVGNSQAVVESFDLYHGIDLTKRYLIPNAVTVPSVTPSQRQSSRAHWGAGEKLLVGLLANFRADGLKNQLMLVRAASRVLAQEPDVKFLLVGYHSAYTDVVRSEINRLGLTDQVHLPGRIDDMNLIAGWDIAVNCSRTEGLSNAVQECMAYGLPMVATDVGGNPDLVEDGKTGLLVPDDDDEVLAQALLKLIREPKLRKALGSAGRRKMQNFHSWDEILAQWIRLYENGLMEVGHA